MTIRKIANAINELSLKGNYEFSKLQLLRKNYRNKKTQSKKPFAGKAIKETYAFHLGGRDEFQFNFGEDIINGKSVFRYGLAFSLHQDHSVHNPISDFKPLISRFNSFLKLNREYFSGFKMWYHKERKFIKSYKNVIPIEGDIFQKENSIFIGKYFEKSSKSINNEDIQIILNEFEYLFPLYLNVQFNQKVKISESIENNKNGEKRLLRITWNTNKWELPSGHKWKKSNQGNKDIAYENQYGFGGEEWLFNQRYNIGGYQYGYIRGLWEVTSFDYINEAFLFSIDSITKDRYLIAHIKNIELLEPSELPKKVVNVFEKYYEDVIAELKYIKADSASYKKKEYLPILRFKMEDAVIYEKVLLNEIKGRQYNRFKPYILTSKLLELLRGKKPVTDFKFIPGKRKNEKGKYSKAFTDQTVTVPGVHRNICEELEKYLQPDYSIEKNNISIDKTYLGDNIADLVIEHQDKSYTFFEIKTSYNSRYNIREALGQLLDYALWNKIHVRKIVIVAPSPLNKEHQTYFNRLKTTIKIDIEYWEYSLVKKDFNIIK